MRVSVDGRRVEVADGATVLEAVRASGGQLPTLCYDERLAPFGACRVCLVAVAGLPAPVAACTTLCRPEMQIVTDDPRTRRVVATVVELVCSELPGPAPRGSELALLAERLGLQRGRFEGATHPVSHDLRHPYLALRRELCISCGRCVRICDELQGAFALTATGRGFDASITVGLDSGFTRSACVACGACADTCPTAAISERATLLDWGPERGEHA